MERLASESPVPSRSTTMISSVVPFRSDVGVAATVAWQAMSANKATQYATVLENGVTRQSNTGMTPLSNGADNSPLN